MYSEALPYPERIQELRQVLVQHGNLGLLLIDASELAQVAREYGSRAFEKVLSMATELVLELRGIEFRTNDLLTINDKGGNAFLVFLSPKRGELHNFTNMGFSIAVDDIGAGYSGLEKVAHLNPKYLKFDMQLVRDIDASYIRREMARALKAFADKMESTIIAEGIEREGELKTCVELGIDYGQGFLLGRPAEGFAAATLPVRVSDQEP